MRVLVFIGVLAVVAFAGYVGIAGYFLAHAAAGLLKVGPIAAVLATATPPTDPLALGYRGDPATALALPFQTVTLTTPLGPSEAWLVPAAGQEAGRAIYVHGIAGAREDGYRALSLLHEAGWSVLLISYRNDTDAPPAPGATYGFGLTEWPDLEAAVAYLAPGDSDRVLVAAESMGGAILGQFLHQSPLASRVSAVALDSPAISFAAVIGHLAAQGEKPLPGLIAWTARQMLPFMSPLPLARAEVAAVYQGFAGPLFIAHGAGDRIVPIGPSQSLAASRSAPTVSLWTGADHLGSYAEDPAAYRAAFGDFLNRIAP
ncbi:alpha/beta hydrolase [Rhodobacter calidifons]|uniref:Alpha/beta hydrolase n=1 Tax=Rhodobacter calidifons TaxID=2715277 RepID=A0ABX0G9W2_9RHOB|nr:alpha/beta hydrolase [Rhodobacter calidifons]NHB77707.1 alpha/beta hydrolase [Rhodobacter calidifons]